MSYDNIKSLTFDEPMKPKSEQNSSHRSSIKSLLTKKFNPLSSSTSAHVNDETADQSSHTKSDVKQKKRRSSFRNFSQFLKRSHSTNTDLSMIASNPISTNVDTQSNKITADLIYQRLHSKQFDDIDSSFLTRSNTSILCNGSGSALVPISEEENPIPIKQQTKYKPTNIDDEDYYYDNTVRPESGALTHQQTQRIAPSLSKKTEFRLFHSSN